MTVHQSMSALDTLVDDMEKLTIRHMNKQNTNNSLPDSGERSEFTTGAVRDAMSGKGTPSLIPIDALRAVSKRFEDGASKYGRDNWKKGIPLSRYVDSLYRHLWQLMEDDQAEDHGGAVIWNAMCLIQTKQWIKEGKLPKELNDL